MILLTGITGQMGSYAAQYWLDRDFDVIGLSRRTSSSNTFRLQELNVLNHKNFSLVEADLVDPSSINRVFRQHEPDYAINYGAQSHVATSFEQPAYTFQVNTIGTLNCLEAIHNYSSHTKFLQLSTSEMFGSNFDEKVVGQKTNSPIIAKYQDENTPFKPCSPYAISKVAAHQLTINYRESYGLFGSTSINFNTEGPLRGTNFVTKKITQYVAKLKKSLDNNEKIEKLRLGNLDTYRDWSSVHDIVRGHFLILQHDIADDFVLCTGRTHTIRQLLDVAFHYVGIEDWKPYVVQDRKYYRPKEVNYLRGTYEKAYKELGWSPKTTFNDLIGEMINYDLETTRA